MKRMTGFIIGVIVATELTAAGYVPIVPKTAPATKLLVLNISKEVKRGDVYHAITCIQGLVNRDSAKKVYFYKHKSRVFPDLADIKSGVGDSEKILLDDVISTPKEYVTLDDSQDYPAL